MNGLYDYRLSDVCSRLSSGKSISSGDIFPQGTVPVYGGNGLRGYTSKANFTGECAIVGRQGAFCGNVRYFSGEAYMTEHAVVVCANERHNTRYLAYLLSTMNLGRLSGQSAQPGLSVRTLGQQIVSLPSKSRQDKVVAVLSSIEDKIEANEKVNHNLQQQIQALFSAWFCTFEPFGGTVPSNWSTRNLSEIAEFVGGYAYKGNELTKSTTVMATIKNFERTGGFKLDGFKEIRPSNKLKSTQRLALYDILVAHTDLTQNAEVIGNAEMVMSLLDYHDAIFSMDLVKVVPKPGCLSQFLLAALLQNRVFKAHCLGYVNGTTVLHLSKKALPEYKLLLPNDLSVLSPLDKAITALYLQISANIEENSRLELLRETLLPQLMSGEIDVSKIEI